ncbi:hypothetical protein [Helicobacter sp. MIT 01-3238]|nr:hypothetical protein [Helicobacter sp. MIT 01-3238]
MRNAQNRVKSLRSEKGIKNMLIPKKPQNLATTTQVFASKI